MNLEEIIARKLEGEKIFRIDLSKEKPPWMKYFNFKVGSSGKNFSYTLDIVLDREKAEEFNGKDIALGFGESYHLFEVYIHSRFKRNDGRDSLRCWLRPFRDLEER